MNKEGKRVIVLPSILKRGNQGLWLVNPHKYRAKVDFRPPWGLAVHTDNVKIAPYGIKRAKLEWKPYWSNGPSDLNVKTRDYKYHLRVDILR
ncbi:MAG TPA: hypothetical protein ENF32_04530 [Thermosulfidibacter takaii]|uniref:Uncharacterized protein n=1 Tax=Thermosulfidibacter takaii TaxID=412593 RepID=A0A7C0U795_9BACT|nr:hypothetical protein [Thermosulfidibacter takaii]